MLKLFKRKKEKPDYSSICPDEIKPESERYIGPCDRCGFMGWGPSSIGMVHYICKHPKGCNAHIIGHDAHWNGDYYEIPDSCPIRKEKREK